MTTKTTSGRLQVPDPVQRRRSSPRPVGKLLAVLALSAVAACGGNGTGAETGAPGAPPSPTSGGAAESTALRIAFVPATTALPLHVAAAQGFFEDNNLDVTLTAAANISDIPSTLGRQFDLAIGTATDLIRAGSAGVDVVQVSGNTVNTKDNPFVRVIVPAGKGIEDFGDLGDKTLGSPTLSGVIHIGTLYTAKQQGVDPATVKGVQVPPPNLPDQLEAGRVDGVEALEPFASQLVKAGNASLGDPFSAIADPLATNFYISQGEWAEANKEAIGRFVTAMEQAAAFIEEKPEESRAILQEYTGLPAPVAASVPLPTYDFEIRAEDLDKWVDVLEELGQLEGDVDTSKLVLSGR
ncbi:MAG: ABC transporter substrate-binding protein [Mycobacteriales bacterium]